MQAVLMAGGKGTRLRPFAASFPKPLVPLGDKPVLEILVRRLKAHGFDRLVLAVGHLAPLIQAYFGDGSRFGVAITYSLETEPLGTAGPLGLVPDLDDDFLVMNGDLLTDLDFGGLMAAHRASGAPVTVARYRVEHAVGLGILDVDAAGLVTGYTEKPVLRYEVSMGCYAFRREVVRDAVPPGTFLDMPDLIRSLVAAGRPVRSVLHEGLWLDIGRPDDYARAQDLYETEPGRF